MIQSWSFCVIICVPFCSLCVVLLPVQENLWVSGWSSPLWRFPVAPRRLCPDQAVNFLQKFFFFHGLKPFKKWLGPFFLGVMTSKAGFCIWSSLNWCQKSGQCYLWGNGFPLAKKKTQMFHGLIAFWVFFMADLIVPKCRKYIKSIFFPWMKCTSQKNYIEYFETTF